MGCCLACLKHRHLDPRVGPSIAKIDDSPVVGVRETRNRPRLNNVIKLDKKPTNRAIPQMKVVYTKKIIGANDPDFIQPKCMAKPKPSLENLFQKSFKGSVKEKSIGLPSRENSTQRIEKDSIHTDNRTASGNDAVRVEEVQDDFIEVNEMHWLSTLKNEIKPRPIKTNYHLELLINSGIMNKEGRQHMKDSLLPQYYSQLQRLTGVASMANKSPSMYFHMPHMPVRAHMQGYSIQPGNSPNQSDTSRGLQYQARPQIVINKPPLIGALLIYNGGVQNSHDVNFKASLNSMRRRNLTTPDLQKMNEASSQYNILAREVLYNSPSDGSPRGNTPIGNTPPSAKHLSSQNPQHSAGLHVEDPGSAVSLRRPLSSSDSLLQVPQLRHISSSVKSIKYTKHKKQHGPIGVNVISEQYSEEENESKDNDISVNSFKPAPFDHASKLNELRKRNKTDLPTDTRLANSEAIFSESKFLKPPQVTSKIPDPPNQIEEIEDPDGESSSSNYIGDKLFELQDDSDNISEK